MEPILLCSDLDRTLLPNGHQPESAQARPLLRKLAARPEVVIAYVSGRGESLLRKAIDEYDIPAPAYAIGDVGTTIYEPGRNWAPWEDWTEEIGRDWKGMDGGDLKHLFSDLDEMWLQEPEKQNVHKLSYYTDADADHRTLVKTLESRLKGEGLRASVIWSVDEAVNQGLVDVLPERATKLHAIRFLMKKKGYAEERTVFAGDSGNDMNALTSGLQAVLVKNARDEVRKEALDRLRERGALERFYLAKGGFMGMNGNYAAGVLEGLAHFLPEAGAAMLYHSNRTT